MPPGSMRSSTTASKASLAAMNRPSRPLSLSSTTWPASFRPRTTKPPTSLSSSTTRIRITLAPLTVLFRGTPPDGYRHIHVMALAPNRQLHAAPRRHGGDSTDQCARTVDMVPIDRHHLVALLDAGMCRRAGFLDAGDGHTASTVLHRDAKPAALDATALAQLRDDRNHQLTRRREADADGAARGRNDRRADGDHLAVHIENRPAGIARIDRRVELQEIVERSGAEVPPARRDDAGGDRAAEAERVARG